MALEPHNIDVFFGMASVEKIDDATAYLAALEDLQRRAEKRSEIQKALEGDVGDFWLVLETRPYMRLRRAHLETLVRCGMMRARNS